MSQLLGEEKRDGTFRVSTLGGDNDDDVYIMMKCVIVCVSQKMITFLKGLSVCLSVCNGLSSLP